MYEAHPTFLQPDNEHIKVWRYMDFTKFVSLIDSRRLFFTRADKCGDPFEGSWPKKNVCEKQHIASGMAMALLKHNAINCWHINEHESAAMWRLYLKSDEGIAVQSTYLKFRSAITDDEKVYVGVVKYIDYETEWIDEENILTPIVYKRKSYEHESEIRAVIVKWPDRNMNFNQETIGDGLKIKVDVEQLIEKVYVAPNSPAWFADLVQTVIQRYGYNFRVFQSKLDEHPVF